MALPAELLDSLPSSDSQLEPPLVIGSDLLYCGGVARPLMKSVSDILVNTCTSSNSRRQFLLVSSFDTGEVYYYLNIMR